MSDRVRGRWVALGGDPARSEYTPSKRRIHRLLASAPKHMMRYVSADSLHVASHMPLLVEIQILAGENAGKHLCLFDPEVVHIGRNPDSDLVFPIKSPWVGYRHAEIRREDGCHVLVGLEGHDRTLVWPGGHPIDRLPLSALTEISLGGVDGPRCRIVLTPVAPFGRYLLTGRLGAGGMAEVYVARQTGPGMFSRPVVLKLIRLDLLERVSAAASMFLDEARIAAEIAHPNVVHVYDVGEEAGTVYIAMEYLRGITLSALLRQVAPPRAPLPCELAAALISQACAGLHAAHELRNPAGQMMNVVHRDVSPSNIMCSPEGLVSVIDFGVARAEGRLQDGSGNMLKGKPAYMAPEQIKHENVDRRADVFAAASVLYELCTGVQIFGRDTMVATLQAVLAGNVPPLRTLRPDAPRTLAVLLARALAPNPAGRPPTAAIFMEALDAVVHQDGRFSSPAAIGRYLSDQGITLLGPVPTPVSQTPAVLTFLRTNADGPQARPPVVPDPTKKHPTAVITSVDPAPSTAVIGRIADTPIAGRYCLLRSLERGEIPREHHYNYHRYLAEALPALPTDSQARSLPDGQLIMALYSQRNSLAGLGTEQVERLARFADHQRAALYEQDNCLPPVLDHGLAWEGGPYFVVVPCFSQDLASAMGTAPRLDDQLALARGLCLAMARIVAAFPGFVHGNLYPGVVAVAGQDQGGPRLVILDSDAEWLLGMDYPAPAERLTVQGPLSPYMPPEFLAGSVPGPAGDVFAIGMMMYELLGGDVQQAAAAIGQSREPPRLPPRRGLPAHVEASVFSALQPDPARRPTAELLAQLITGVPVPDTARVLIASPPPPGEVISLSTPSGHRVVMRAIELSPLHDRDPVPLPLSGETGLLLAPLHVSMCAGSLMVDLAREAMASVPPRPGLYHDAHHPGTRCENYSIPSHASGSFDVGHRRTQVHKVHYVSTASDRGDARLQVDIPDLRLHITTAPPAQRLALLHWMDPQTGTVHMACVTVLLR